MSNATVSRFTTSPRGDRTAEIRSRSRSQIQSVNDAQDFATYRSHMLRYLAVYLEEKEKVAEIP